MCIALKRKGEMTKVKPESDEDASESKRMSVVLTSAIPSQDSVEYFSQLLLSTC